MEIINVYVLLVGKDVIVMKVRIEIELLTSSYENNENVTCLRI
jgi:hypothetical protein